MPVAPERVCAGCGTSVVTRGRCAVCTRRSDQRRGTHTARGYGTAWDRFRRQFMAALIDQGILPVCGAVLPGGPVTQDSQCARAGIPTMEGLQVDHEPPLTDAERRDERAVCDMHRVQLLCDGRGRSGQGCHPAKTKRQQLAARQRRWA